MIDSLSIFGGINTDLAIVKISVQGFQTSEPEQTQPQALCEICKPQLKSPSHYMPPNKSFEIREAPSPRL